MNFSTIQSQLLSQADRDQVEETLRELEVDGRLPESVREPLLGFLRLVVGGRSATILETEADLTSTQAAAVLCVSRPYLNKLLEEGRIPFHWTGSERRVACVDVLEFRKQRDLLKVRRAEAAATYHSRRNERIASTAGVTVNEATELGFDKP